MIEILKDISSEYPNASIQMPNGILTDIRLKTQALEGKASFKNVSLMYSYLTVVSMLYKYALFVGTGSNSYYIQNSDLKELLGYSRTTKSVDRFIKERGVLDAIGLTRTIKKDYPIGFNINNREFVNNIPIREFVYYSELEGAVKENFNRVVRNRNYMVKEPLLLFRESVYSPYGTLYDYENTHKVTIGEIIKIFSDGGETCCTQFALYFFIKSMAKSESRVTLPLKDFQEALNISYSGIYSNLDYLESKGLIASIRRGRQPEGEDYLSNEYHIL